MRCHVLSTASFILYPFYLYHTPARLSPEIKLKDSHNKISIYQYDPDEFWSFKYGYGLYTLYFKKGVLQAFTTTLINGIIVTIRGSSLDLFQYGKKLNNPYKECSF